MCSLFTQKHHLIAPSMSPYQREPLFPHSNEEGSRESGKKVGLANLSFMNNLNFCAYRIFNACLYHAHIKNRNLSATTITKNLECAGNDCNTTRSNLN